MNDRLYPFPDAAQEYLEQQYGLEPYSYRHLQVLIDKGIYPRPLRVSPRRQANRQKDLDAYAHKIINSPGHLSKTPPALRPTGFLFSRHPTAVATRRLNGGSACK